VLLLPFRSAVGAQDSGEGTAMPGEDDEPQQCADEPGQDAGRHRKVEGQNVDQNRRNDDQTQRNKASTQQQEAAKDLEPKGNDIEMRGKQGAHELSGQTGGHGRIQEVEKGVQAEEDKDEAQQDACDQNGDFHMLLLLGEVRYEIFAGRSGDGGTYLLQSRAKEGPAVDSAGHQLRYTTYGKCADIRDADEAENHLQIWFAEVKGCRRSSW
jgi:hypothetical protein